MYEVIGKIMVTLGIMLLFFAGWVVVYILGDTTKTFLPQWLKTILGFSMLGLLFLSMFTVIYIVLGD